MSYMPYNLRKALGYAIVLWMIGFVWGTIVFMVPTLMDMGSVPYISKYPAISVPIIVIYVILLFVLMPGYLEPVSEKRVEGLKFGFLLLVSNFVLDAEVYVGLFGDTEYFTYFSIWLAYALFIIIPWLTGHRLQQRASA